MTQPPAGRSVERSVEPEEPSGAGDVVPLSQRLAALALVRLVVAGCVVVVLAFTGNSSGEHLLGTAAYVVGASAFGLAVASIGRRRLAVAGFGLLLCADGVAVQIAQQHLGQRLAGDLVMATFLGAVCLLGSFRTGVKMAVWQSLLLAVRTQGAEVGVFPPLPPGQPRGALGAELVLLWLLVMVICTAAAVSERELRRRRYDAEALRAFAAELHRDDEPRLVLSRTTDFLVSQLDARRVLVCSAAEGEGLRLLGGHDLTRPEVAPAPVSTLLGLAGTAGRTARLLRLDPARDPWLDAHLPGARRLVVVPLVAGLDTRVVWVVFEHGSAGRPGGANRAGSMVERRVIASAGQVGATAALALSRATLFQRSRAYAVTDQLTGLLNRRGFDDRLAALGAPERRSGFSLVIVDVDHFKTVNDTFGHQTGDLVLVDVARVLRRSAPEGAVVCRYGGEEFAVLLPDVSLPEAAAVAETLRAAVGELHDPRPITASFGVAAWPGGAGCEPGELIDAADRALYEAKTGGRNRVMTTAGALTSGGRLPTAPS